MNVTAQRKKERSILVVSKSCWRRSQIAPHLQGRGSESMWDTLALQQPPERKKTEEGDLPEKGKG